MHLEHVLYLINHLCLDMYSITTSHDHTAELRFSNSECAGQPVGALSHGVRGDDG